LPSPVAHGIAGFTLHVLLAREDRERLDVARAAVIVGAALAPDLDLLLRFVDGRNHHQGASHSVGAALLAAVVAAVLLRLTGSPRLLSLAAGVGLAWLSHVGLDYLSNDTNPPIGLMALWPLSSAYYKFPVPLFLDIGRSLDWATLRSNLLAAAWESAVLGPALWLAWRLRRRGSRA
jgi:membrane-bound metal-dependent hydrolase YbcI (DUF457 family)